MPLPDRSLNELMSRPLIFVQGKGGVGKTTLATALSRVSAKTKKTLLVTIENPLLPPGEIREVGENLWTLNNEGSSAFEEYAGLKIGSPKLVKIFLSNRLMRYFVKAAPGIRELVLMGKIWHEMKHFDRIIVDMPATGHGLTMFQSISNWKKLFEGSILAKDSQSILDVLSDPKYVSHLIVALPEEMPLTESLELSQHLKAIFPKSDPFFLVNRLSPEPEVKEESTDAPFAKTATEHFSRKHLNEIENLTLWDSLAYFKLPFFEPTRQNAFESIIGLATSTLNKKIDSERK